MGKSIGQLVMGSIGMVLGAIAKFFSFIPRLVVHKAEVQKIFHPESSARINRQVVEDNLEVEPDVLQDGDLDVSNGSIFLRGFVPDVSAVRRRVRQLAVELPENMRTAPVILAEIATELPATLANRAIALPSNILHAATELPTAIITLTEGVEGTLEAIVQISSNVARDVAELPHRASHEWSQLLWVLLALLCGPLAIFCLLFFIPINSVDDGIDGNRMFVYVISTFFDLAIALSCAEGCNFAMPKAQIPVKARVAAVFAVLVATKASVAALVEGLFGVSIFPIPFSFLICPLFCISGLVSIIYMMTPKRAKANFWKMQCVLCAYFIALATVIAWSVGVRRLNGQKWLQTFAAFLFGPLRFICKILILAPMTTQLNPYRWLQMGFVVDIMYTQVQDVTFPYTDNPWTPLISISTEIFTLIWRWYGGVDRLALWWSAIWMTPEKHHEHWSAGILHRASGFTKVTKGCIRASIPVVAKLNMTLREPACESDKIMRTLTGDTQDTSQEERFDSSSIAAGEPSSGASAPGTLDVEEACGLADERDINSSDERVLDLENGAEVLQLQIRARRSILSLQGSEGSQRSFCSVDLSESGDTSDSTDWSLSHLSTEEELAGLQHLQSFTSLCSRAALVEEDWEQRPLYHVVDSTGSNVIAMIVRVKSILTIEMARNSPVSHHLNDSFEISDAGWKEARTYGWTVVALNLILLAIVGFLFFRQLGKSRENKLSLSRVMSYIFKDHFWTMFFWLLCSQTILSASMINQFGADFSMRFKWLSCLQDMAWPACPA